MKAKRDIIIRLAEGMNWVGSRPVPSLCPHPAAMAASLCDSTSCPAEHTPEIALKHILHATNMPKELRVKVAKAGLTVDFVANSASNVEDFLKAAEVLLGCGEAMGATEANKLVFKTYLRSLFNKAVAYIKEEQPGPDWQKIHTGSWRYRILSTVSTAVNSKIDTTTLHSSRTQNHTKRFIERLNRDVIVHESIPVYKLGEIRLASEPNVHRSGISENSEKLLQISKQELAATVKDATDAINHLTAFFIALEYLGHFAYAKVKVGTNGVVSGGAITNLDELVQRQDYGLSSWQTRKSGARCKRI